MAQTSRLFLVQRESDHGAGEGCGIDGHACCVPRGEASLFRRRELVAYLAPLAGPRVYQFAGLVT